MGSHSDTFSFRKESSHVGFGGLIQLYTQDQNKALIQQSIQKALACDIYAYISPRHFRLSNRRIYPSAIGRAGRGKKKKVKSTLKRFYHSKMTSQI